MFRRPYALDAGRKDNYTMSRISPKLYRQLQLSANNAFSALLLRGASVMRKVPRTEVGFVAAIAIDGSCALASAWRRDLASIGLEMNILGVFCHGTPQIAYKWSNRAVRCELADLLVVIDVRESTSLSRWATLIQAKMACRKTEVKLTGPSSINQLRLYQNWPRFEFLDPEYGNASFLLTKGRSGEPGSFGVIDRHMIPPVWTQHPPTPSPAKVTTEPELGAFLAGMASSRVGFGRRTSQKPKDEWSKLVDLLLKVTYAKSFRHRTTLDDLRPPRGHSAFIVVKNRTHDVSKASSGGAPPIDVAYEFGDDPDSAISLFHIEITLASD
jgi:hypothetical protein